MQQISSVYGRKKRAVSLNGKIMTRDDIQGSGSCCNSVRDVILKQVKQSRSEALFSLLPLVVGKLARVPILDG